MSMHKVTSNNNAANNPVRPRNRFHWSDSLNTGTR